MKCIKKNDGTKTRVSDELAYEMVKKNEGTLISKKEFKKSTSTNIK